MRFFVIVIGLAFSSFISTFTCAQMIKEIYDDHTENVVIVQFYDPHTPTSSSGAGFVICNSSRGVMLILAAAHILEIDRNERSSRVVSDIDIIFPMFDIRRDIIRKTDYYSDVNPHKPRPLCQMSIGTSPY